MREILRVKAQETLDWSSSRRSLREILIDFAFAESPSLQKQQQEHEDSGGDFWSTRRLEVHVEGVYFVVYLVEEEE